MAKIPKTLAEISMVVGASGKKTADIVNHFNEIGTAQIQAMIKQINSLYKTEEDRLKVYEKLNDISIRFLDTENEVRRQISYQLNDLQKVNEQKQIELDRQTKIKEQAKKYGDVLQNVSGKILSKILEQNKQIFQTAKDMQLASNLTWKEYSQAYNQAFEATRRINKEVGQSITNAKELIETQNFLLQSGFRNIETADLTNISASVFAMTRTLGDFPNELLLSFQQSFRLFGQQTDQFVTSIGNRLNAFSSTFGFSIQMLTQTVAAMTQENAFLFRNNMRAQVQANENLMRAAALSGAMGLDSAAFISRLASTSQFGTMSEMADIYQGGALLQGFDTSQFQQSMISGDAGSATEMLFRSIGQTLSSIDDQYLRAEYMQRIGGAFGLDRSDLLAITNNAGNMDEYLAKMQEDLLDVDSSMLNELSELKMALVDRVGNWWESTGAAEGTGKLLQNLGLVGVDGTLKFISSQLAIITGQSLTGGRMAGSIANLFMGGGGDSAPMALANAPWQAGSSLGGPSALGRFGMGAGGLAVGVGGNVLGRSVQANTNLSNTNANLIGGAINIGTGAAGGAMIGSIVPGIGTAIGAGIGAAVGGIAGGINTYLGAQERKTTMQEMEDQERAAARQRLQGPSSTGDPVVDAINNMNSNLTNVLNSNTAESIKMSFVLDTANKTAAGFEGN